MGRNKRLKDIVDILVRRDGISEDEAWDVVEYVEEMVEDALAEEDLEQVEDIIASELGLEPDYIHHFLF